MIETVLFDMDGTLLPMEQDKFVGAYFRLLAQKLAPRGYKPETLFPAIWKGVAAMVKNDGKCTNDALFWETFSSLMGDRVLDDMPLFEEFYRVEFNGAKAACGFTPMAQETVRLLAGNGIGRVLASNPVFPMAAQENRIRWSGLSPQDFCYITSYENSRYCKPNPAYYTEIAEKLSLDPAKCLMVGNDVMEDGAAHSAGMSVFLLTDCLIDTENAGCAKFPHGSWGTLLAFLKKELCLS